MNREFNNAADIESWYASEVIRVTKEHWDQYREKIIAVKKEKEHLYRIIIGAEEPKNIEIKYEYKGT